MSGVAAIVGWLVALNVTAAAVLGPRAFASEGGVAVRALIEPSEMGGALLIPELPDPFRGGHKRHLQGFAEPASNMGKIKAMNMLRAMINFRRY